MTGIIHLIGRETAMKLLVTGGLGFIGSNFIRYMLAKYNDTQIINLDKLSIGSNPANLKDIETDERYTFIKGDITNTQLIENLISQVDAVVNIASETHVDRSIADPWPFIQSNTIGALTLFEAVKKHEKRLLHISTDEVYGDILQGSFREDDRLKHLHPTQQARLLQTSWPLRTTGPMA
jgi:dTDP-glucose 4,6-dehydratase